MQLSTNARAVLAAVIICCAGPAASAAAGPDAKGAQVSVTGEGTVAAVPNLAVLDSAVVTTDADAAAALSQNSAKLRSTLAAFHAAGIADADIATSGFSVTPRYGTREDGDHAPPPITGYTVRNAVTVKVRDLKRLGAVLQAAVGHGANDVGALRFTFAEPAKLQDEARRKAMADARHRAMLYADAAGMTLGPVLRITESGGEVAEPFVRSRVMAAAASPVPIARGQREVRAEVRTVWRLTPR